MLFNSYRINRNLMQKGKISSTKGQAILIVGFVGYMGSVILKTSAVYHRGVTVFIYIFTE